MTEHASVSLEIAERQLDRVQTFFPRIDSKVSAIFAITSAQIAVAALNVTSDDLGVWWIFLLLACFVGGAGWTMLSLYYCTYPHLKGGESSLIYFKKIAERSEADYATRYGAITEDELKADFIKQIWRNSQIVDTKYWYLKNATIASMLSLIPWGLLLLNTTLAKGKVPVVG